MYLTSQRPRRTCDRNRLRNHLYLVQSSARGRKNITTLPAPGGIVWVKDYPYPLTVLRRIDSEWFYARADFCPKGDRELFHVSELRTDGEIATANRVKSPGETVRVSET